jgi:replicative DNA helicase
VTAATELPFEPDETCPEAVSAERPVSVPPLRKVEGRLPPHDLDAEGVVLAALLDHPERLPEVKGLEARHFYSDANGIIFTAIVKLAETSSDFDLVAVKGALADSGKLAAVGGVPYLVQLVADAPSCLKLGAQAERIRRGLAHRARDGRRPAVQPNRRAPGA